MVINHLLNEMILQVQDFYLHLSRANKKTRPLPGSCEKVSMPKFSIFKDVYNSKNMSITKQTGPVLV